MSDSSPKSFVALVIAFVVLTGAVWAMVAVHASTPAHLGALTRREFGQFEKHVEGSLERIEVKLDRVLEK